MGENWRATKASLWLVCTASHLTRTGCWWRALQLQETSFLWALILAGDYTKQTHAEKAAWHPASTPGNYWSALRTNSQFPPLQYAFSCLERLIFPAMQQYQSFTHKESPNHHYSEQTVFFPLFLLSAVAVDSTLACSAHAGFSLLMSVCSLHLQHIWVRYKEQEQALMKAQSLPPFTAAATLPHLRLIQNTTSSFRAAHRQHLHISVSFYSSFLFPSLFFSLLRLLCFWSFPGENLQLERVS